MEKNKTVTIPKLKVPALIKKFQANPIDMMKEIQDLYGDLVFFPAPLNILFIFNPTHIKQILFDERKVIIKGKETKKLSKIVNEGLILADGKTWRRKRKIIRNHFRLDRITVHEKIIRETVQKEIASWPVNKEVELNSFISDLVFNISSELFFGGLSKQYAKEFKQAIEKTAELMFEKIKNPLSLPFFIKTPTNKRIENEIETIDRIISNLIQDFKDQDSVNKESLLADLINDENGLTTGEVRDELISFIVAGYETTAAMLTWTFYELGQNKKLLSEYSKNPDGRELKNLLKETLRFYPPFLLLTRTNTEKISIAGKDYKSGTSFITSAIMPQTDERFWSDVQEFKPERFKEELNLENYDYTYFPFGAGPRKCIGEALAYSEGIVVLEELFKKFEFSISDEKVGPYCRIILTPDRPVKATLFIK